MNNKAVTYVLLFLVLVVWSYVFWKIFDFGSETPIVKNQLVRSKDTLVTYTYDDSLVNDYPDPFFKRRERVSNNKAQANSSGASLQPKSSKVIEPVYVPNVDFNYIGMINNAGSSKSLAVIKEGGRDVILKLNDSYKEFKLVFISKDSIGLRISEKRVIYVKKSL